MLLVVTTRVTALAKFKLNGAGLVPPLIVPLEYIFSVAATVELPSTWETYTVLPLPDGVVICKSRLCPDVEEMLHVGSINKAFDLAASLSGEASTPGVMYVLVICVYSGNFFC
ncbi:hypothetical protein [Paenibacillus rigui]|uniref:Uncharacterized protein n=1 Tax=Paenibacillus rigui TaxID=554312 RepID=A0A229UNU8_9BACL|nr:hypothetical protein [Paenibacillus rigui]OXM85070.1 hypothetical protein CF651_15770 [Paenibacillus rigui]